MLEALQSFSAKAKKNKSQNELRGMSSGGGGSGIFTQGVKVRAGSGTLFGAGRMPGGSRDSGLPIYRFPQQTQTPQVAQQ